MLLCLNLLYNTKINWKTGATPFRMVHGQGCQYLVHLFNAKPNNEVLMKDGFAECLDEQRRDPHCSAREILGQTSLGGKMSNGGKFTGTL